MKDFYYGMISGAGLVGGGSWILAKMADISDWRGTLLIAGMVVLISAMHLIGDEP